MWWSWSSLPALVLLSELTVVRVQTAPCQTCRKLTESFIKVSYIYHMFIHVFCFLLTNVMTFSPFVSLCLRAWRKQPIRTLGEVTLHGKKKSWPSMHAGKKRFYFKSQPHSQWMIFITHNWLDQQCVGRQHLVSQVWILSDNLNGMLSAFNVNNRHCESIVIRSSSFCFSTDSVSFLFVSYCAVLTLELPQILTFSFQLKHATNN